MTLITFSVALWHGVLQLGYINYIVCISMVLYVTVIIVLMTFLVNKFRSFVIPTYIFVMKYTKFGILCI